MVERPGIGTGCKKGILKNRMRMKCEVYPKIVTSFSPIEAEIETESES